MCICCVVLAEWRHLPRLVSHAHVPLLQGMQLAIDLSEAYQLHSSFSASGGSALENGAAGGGGAQSLLSSTTTMMKQIIKPWRTRVPAVSDELAFWSELFTWRQLQYGSITQFLEGQLQQLQLQQAGETGAQAMGVGVPAQQPFGALSSLSLYFSAYSANAVVDIARAARRHGLPLTSLEILPRIHSISRVPVSACFQKLRQQIKAHWLLSTHSNKAPLYSVRTLPLVCLIILVLVLVLVSIGVRPDRKHKHQIVLE